MMRRQGRTIITAAAFVLVFSLAWNQPASAQGDLRVAAFALAEDKFSEKAAAVFNRLTRDNFRRAKEFQLVDLRTYLEQDVQDKRLQLRQRALALLQSGKDQYDNLELDAATEELTRAVETFQKAAGRLGAGEKYMETLLYLGASYILSGDNDRGTESFRAVAMFDKRKTLDPKIFPPSMIEIFNQVKDEVSAASMGTVVVKSTPMAAEVYLNGVYKGITPVTLARVPEGTHFVRVEMDGYLPWGQRVEFYATHEETTEATLSKAPMHGQFYKNRKQLVVDDLDEDTPEGSAVIFGEWLRVDRLVLLQIRQRGDEISAQAALIKLQPAQTLSFREASFNFVSGGFLSRADAFVTSLYRDVKLPPEDDGGKKPSGSSMIVETRCNSDTDCATGEVCDVASGRCIPYAPEGDKFYERWWFWAIVGGGLVVAGGTSVLVWYLLQPEEGAIEFTF